jgi:hypothetical protein
MHWSWRKEDIRTVGRRTSRSLMQLLPSVRGDRALWRLWSCHITHSIPFIWQLHWMLWMEKTFIKFHADADNYLWCETSRPKRALARVKITFSWIDQTWWVHEVVCEIITIGLKSGPTPSRVLARNQLSTSTTRAKMVDICETTTIWLDDRHEPRSTLGWEWMMCKHYWRKSSRELKQIRKGLCSPSLQEAVSLGSECNLL